MTVVDEYLAKLDDQQKLALTNICQIVRQTVPDSKEVITYGMPGFKYRGKYLVSFGVFKDHMSLFPGSGAIEAYQDNLMNYKCSKGTIQFTINNQLPNELIKLIIIHRKKDIES